MTRFSVNIDPISNTTNLSVQVNDHKLKKTHILDKAASSLTSAKAYADQFIIGVRRQMGDEQSSKLSPSVSKPECVGSIPTTPANKVNI